MIVMKFGGTSVESAAAIERAAGIVRRRAAADAVVVVSAIGKTTNRLLAAAQLAVRNERTEALRQLDQLAGDHRQVAWEVSGSHDLVETVEDHFRELRELMGGLAVLGELTPRSVDAVSSYGERMSSLIVAAALQAKRMPATHLDAREVIRTDSRHTQAAPLFEATDARLRERVPPLLARGLVVMGGFIGSTLEGVTTTLGRGGSDYSASIVGAALDAEEIQIWTDVDGMLTADPTVVPEAHLVKTICFDEAAELAYFGAKVLHPATVLPARERNIPVRIVNSRRPGTVGTTITAEATPCANVVKSIACKRRITAVHITSTRMLMAFGFLERIFAAFARHETPVDMVATSEVSVSLTIDSPERLEAICAELAPIAEVTVEREQAIVCLVGDGLRSTPGVIGRVFAALGDVGVRMISQGASRRNVSFVVAETELRAAVERLHGEFFAEPDTAVFA